MWAIVYSNTSGAHFRTGRMSISLRMKIGGDGPQERHAGVRAPDAAGAVRGPEPGQEPGGAARDFATGEGDCQEV